MIIFKKAWDFCSSLIAIHPPSMEDVRHTQAYLHGKDMAAFDQETRQQQMPVVNTLLTTNQIHLTQDKVRFDNFFRLLLSSISFVVCFVLWSFDALPNWKPILGIYIGYGIIHLVISALMLNSPYVRYLDFSVITLDLVGIAFAIFVTGGVNSPLYFLFFVPLLIQSYHRDWATIVLYGFGGMASYALVSFLAYPKVGSSELGDLLARLFFMLVTVSIAIVGIQILKNREKIDKKRLSRMMSLTQVSQTLNQVTSFRELKLFLNDLVSHLNKELGEQLNGWARVLLVEKHRDLMVSIMDPQHVRLDFKQEIPTRSCPALQNNVPFQMKDSTLNEGCPTEPLPFKSHICMPISGMENETFGILFVGSEIPNAISQEEIQFLGFIGRATGLTIQRLIRMEELGKFVEMDSCATATFLKSTKNLDETYHPILEGLVSILGVEQATLMVWERTMGVLVTKEVVGPHSQFEKNLKFNMGEGLPGQTLEKGIPIYTTNLEEDARLNQPDLPFTGLLSLPLFNVKQEPIGVINAWVSEHGRTFSPFEISLASTYVTRAAMAIENARLHNNQRETLSGFKIQEEAA
jgi:GAF domain-containing protein